jgi:translation initiation factor 5A
MSDNEDFEKNENSQFTEPISVGAVKKGSHCMLKGHPCKVTDYSTAKPGKHGSAKATIVGNDIFTNKKYEDTAPTGATTQFPLVVKAEYEVADIDEDDFVSAILEDGDLKADLKLDRSDD